MQPPVLDAQSIISKLKEELVVFAKSVCPLLLSVDVAEETDLPCSVKGKLGGPSQRRLASFMTSSVLQAVLLMRTVASVSSWCSQHAKDVSLNSSFTFLSEFSWKVIQSPTYTTEVRQVCINCGVCMGKYFYATCKLFDDDVSKQQYHCNGCGICRIGGRENFFHCYRCGCCYSAILKNSHPCVEGAMHHDCPVCFEKACIGGSIGAYTSEEAGILDQHIQFMHDECVRASSVDAAYQHQ